MTGKLRILLMGLALLAGVCPALAQPTLHASLAGHQCVLSWPTSFTNYTLQKTTNLAAASWVTVSNPAPVTVGSSFTITLTNIASPSFFRLRNTNATTAISGMVLIPASDYTIGDPLDGEFDAVSATVYVSAFYMDVNPVTYDQWVNVYFWAVSNGYDFTYNYFVNSFDYKGPNYPAIGMSWYDAVKWCNARSQLVGLAPVYYTDEEFTQIYDSGEVNVVYANWKARATGYRPKQSGRKGRGED